MNTPPEKEGFDLSEPDRRALRTAKQLLENPGLAARLTHMLGAPLEQGFEMLPKNWSERIGQITEISLEHALDCAVRTLAKNPEPGDPANWFHRCAVAATGAAGGAFGLAALSVELPVSTVLMLRSVARIAQCQGENIEDIQTRLACLEVFAFGGTSGRDDASEAGYYVLRSALARTITDAARHIAGKGLGQKGAPALVRLISQISSRFGVVVSQKAAAMAVPVIGAAGGCMINTVFMQHFQNMGQGHFTVRRLERIYGRETVQEIYRQLPLR